MFATTLDKISSVADVITINGQSCTAWDAADVDNHMQFYLEHSFDGKERPFLIPEQTIHFNEAGVAQNVTVTKELKEYLQLEEDVSVVTMQFSIVKPVTLEDISRD